MIVDSSALVAILMGEQEERALVVALGEARRLAMSAGTYLETGIVVDGRRNAVFSRRLDELLDQAGIEVEPVTVRQARIARAAYRDFGRGSGHPARLNFGDCFSYALAIDRAEELLCMGDDFGHTGVRVAAW